MEWVNFRKELKKPLTPTAIKMQHKLLSQMTEQEAILSIENSINNGWQGLFKPRCFQPKPETCGLSNPKSENLKEPCKNWRGILSPITGKTYEDWMTWRDVSAYDRSQWPKNAS